MRWVDDAVPLSTLRLRGHYRLRAALGSEFYCYEIRDPAAGNEPIYVGKGSGSRLVCHDSAANEGLRLRIERIRAEGQDATVRVVARFGRDEDAALRHERYLIGLYGRVDMGTGTLLNLTDGGQGTSGARGAYFNLIGQRFGRLTVVDELRAPQRSARGSARWLCQCDCGTRKIVIGSKLKNGTTVSCRCASRELASRRQRKDLVGQRFGRLIVLSDAGRSRGNGYVLWLCQCDCGEKKSIRSGDLQKGRTQSCGCRKREATKLRHVKRRLALKICVT